MQNRSATKPISAREAAERLGIKLDTLYAYVSRGLLRSMEVAGSRERHYDPDEVENFRTVRGGVRGVRPPPVMLMPEINSAICLIENHRIFYRGRDALRLADTATLEEVAALLWEDGSPAAPTPTFPRLRGRGRTSAAAVPLRFDRRGSKRGAGQGHQQSPSPAGGGGGLGWGLEAGQLGLIERCQIRLAEMASEDHAALDLSHAGVVRTGRLILAELAASVGGGAPSALPVHEQLAARWRLDPAGGDLVRRCLVLLADHELNASTFVARCVASTGATPYAAVAAALSALSGRRHGGASARAEALFRYLGDSAEPLPALAARLARGEPLPGLDQPLYPEGDPRCLSIVEAISTALPEAGAHIAAAAVAAVELTGQYPNVDFALGAVTVALGLPPGSALGLFLTARAVGWIAHAIEQYESGTLIRPRARYTGLR